MKHASEVPLRSNALESGVQHPARTASILLPALLLALSGCGIDSVTTGPTPGALVSGLTGVVHGGQSPVTGSVVQLMVPSTVDYANTPSVLASTTSDSHGNFTLPAYTCPVPDQLVYLEATGGNPGTGNNSAIDEIALLGNCSTLASHTQVFISELTTVAGAYALAPFAISSGILGTGIGTKPTNLTGLNNAFGPANNLISFSNGYANSSTSTMVLPTQLLNTLGNILSACVNSSGPTSTPCRTLFTDTTVNGVPPVTTFQAALNIALHPGANISGSTGLYSLATTNPPFQPAMTSATAPNDFTLAIGYNGGGIAPQGVNSIAIDASGTDFYTNSASTTSGLIEITPTGTFPGGATGFANASLGKMNNLAIDESGTIWVDVNSSAPSVTGITSSGSVYESFSSAISPNGIAIDAAGDIWYSSGGNSNNGTYEFKYNGGGNYTYNATFAAIDHFEVDVCITPGYIYTISYGNTSEPSSFTQYNTSTATAAGVTPDGGNSGLSGCAVDNSGNLWLADFGVFDGIEVYSPSLSLSKSYAITTPVYPQDLALDGLGNAFVATFVPQGTASYNSGTTNPASLVEFTSTGTLVSPAAGYFPSTGQSNSGNTGLIGLTSEIIAPGGIAIDASGNVWLSGNDGQSVPSSGNVNNGNLPAYVTEIIGIAAPVVTPKSVALKQGQIAARP